jgi:osmotically-inducible protein OsmY
VGIHVARYTQRSDAELERQVLLELERDPRVNVRDLAVWANSGAVTLSGTVDSPEERNAAHEVAERVVGVLEVIIRVQVLVPEQFDPS